MNGHYPYPLLEIMNTPQRTAFYCAAGTVAGIVGLAITRLQARLDNHVRGHGPSKVDKSKIQ